MSYEAKVLFDSINHYSGAATTEPSCLLPSPADTIRRYDPQIRPADTTRRYDPQIPTRRYRPADTDPQIPTRNRLAVLLAGELRCACWKRSLSRTPAPFRLRNPAFRFPCNLSQFPPFMAIKAMPWPHRPMAKNLNVRENKKTHMKTTTLRSKRTIVEDRPNPYCGIMAAIAALTIIGDSVFAEEGIEKQPSDNQIANAVANTQGAAKTEESKDDLITVPPTAATPSDKQAIAMSKNVLPTTCALPTSFFYISSIWCQGYALAFGAKGLP